MMKRLFRVFLLCFPLILLLSVHVFADDIVDSGECGDNVRWSVNSAGTLSITGSGAMWDYFTWNTWNQSIAPWNTHLSMITSLTVSSGITGIGEYAFYELERLTKVTLPDSLIKIGKGAFQSCTSLTKITLPDGIASIADYTFADCFNLLSFVIPEKVAGIGVYAFSNCDRLTKIVIPANVENVSANAFMSCDRLKSVTILGNIPIIKAETFSDCPALEEITIPDSVAIIEENAFSGCATLKTVNYGGTADMWKEISVDGGNEALDAATVSYDTSAGAAYRINGISVSGGREGMGGMPYGSFLATVSITNRLSGTSPLVFIASYASNGTFLDFAYVAVKEPIGGTVEVTLPIDNSAMNVAELRAFVVSSTSDFTPLGAPVSYP